MSVAGRERGSSRPPSLPARHGATDDANDADHQDDHHQTKEVKGDAYTEGRRARAVGSSARHRFLIIIYIIIGQTQVSS